MDTFTITFTAINACFTFISILCAIYAARQSKYQTDIMRQQLEHELEPDFALTGRLEGISRAIYKVESAINGLHNK